MSVQGRNNLNKNSQFDKSSQPKPKQDDDIVSMGNQSIPAPDHNKDMYGDAYESGQYDKIKFKLKSRTGLKNVITSN